jgi:hypothetical protein
MLIINVGRIDRTWIRGKMASPDAYTIGASEPTFTLLVAMTVVTVEASKKEGP